MLPHTWAAGVGVGGQPHPPWALPAGGSSYDLVMLTCAPLRCNDVNTFRQVSRCQHSLIVIDEVQFMISGVLNILVDLLGFRQPVSVPPYGKYIEHGRSDARPPARPHARTPARPHARTHAHCCFIFLSSCCRLS